MSEQIVRVVTIHDLKNHVLALDLKDVLDTLRGSIDAWAWHVDDLECTGARSREVCDAIRRAEGRGIWLSSAELVDLANSIDQTIDGQFLAFAVDGGPPNLTQTDLDLAFFSENNCKLGIRVVDSSFIEVYLKDEQHLKALKGRFRDVREPDLSLYFLNR